MVHFIPAVAGFPLLLGVAILQGWHAVDLVWAIWFSGIAMTAYAAFLLAFLDEGGFPAKFKEDRRFPLLVAKHIGDTAVSGLVGAAFFVMAASPVLFGPLALLLNALVPLLPPEPPGSPLRGFDIAVMVYVEASVRYWPAALICCAVQTPSIVRAMARKHAGGSKFMLFLLGEALTAGSVVLVALVVVMLGGAFDSAAAGLADYILMALLLFPWSVLWRRPQDNSASSAGPKAHVTAPRRKH